MKLRNYVMLSLLILPLSAEAVCFLHPFQVTGVGISTEAAEKNAEAEADLACRSDDHNWSSRRSDYTYQILTDEQIEASAEFQCCTSW